jgi:hypothetical protein
LRRRVRREVADIEHRPQQFGFRQDRLRVRKQARAAVRLLAHLWGSTVGSFHELIVRLQCRVPLDHPPFATLTIITTAVSNGQLGINHAVPGSAMRTTKVKLRDGRRAPHSYISHVVSKSKSPARTRLLNSAPRGSWGAGAVDACRNANAIC